jgi:hypothetical protein
MHVATDARLDDTMAAEHEVKQSKPRRGAMKGTVRLVIWVLLFVIVLSSATSALAYDSCTYATCQCTGYAKSRRPDMPCDLGNALTWA